MSKIYLVTLTRLVRETVEIPVEAESEADLLLAGEHECARMEQHADNTGSWDGDEWATASVSKAVLVQDPTAPVLRATKWRDDVPNE